MFHWKYFDESNDYMQDQIRWFMVELENADQASRVAQSIDALSENSDHETKTQTESAWQQAFMKQFADIGLIVTAIMGAVFFTLLLLTGNTMAQAVRERIPELAGLKTIGFSNRAVLRSEEHTSELQSLMRISYAVFCLKKKKKKNNVQHAAKKYIQ